MTPPPSTSRGSTEPGRPLGELETFSNLHNPVFSPDQKRLAADNAGVWIVDLERGAPTKVDTADENSREPITVVVNWDALTGR